MSQSRETVAQGQLYCPTCERTFASGSLCPTDSTRLVLLDTPDALIGRILDGRYTIVSKLGSGGMGAVYRATQHSVGRDVAIKVVAANLVSDALAIKRFLREAKLASKLSHPNAVGVLDFGQTADHVFFLVMELVEGRTLEDALAAEPVLSPARVIRIGMQICDALEGAHGLQIVHRDLKPANVMLLASGRDHVKVLDFGIARSLASDEKMTHEGSAVGTPAFMAPEVASGRDADARADLYSLGCMLYEMATGRQPFTGSSVQEVLTLHLTTPPAPMYGVPDALATIVLRLLEKEPADRFPTATATREALEAAMFELQVKRRPSEPILGGSDEQTMITSAADPGFAPPSVAAQIATAPMIASEPPAPIASPRRSSRGLVLGVAAIGALGVAAGVFVAIRSATGDDPPPRVLATQPMKVIAAAPPDASAPPDAPPLATVPQLDAAVAEPALDAAVPAHHHHQPPAKPDAGIDETHTPF